MSDSTKRFFLVYWENIIGTEEDELQKPTLLEKLPDKTFPVLFFLLSEMSYATKSLDNSLIIRNDIQTKETIKKYTGKGCGESDKIFKLLVENKLFFKTQKKEIYQANAKYFAKGDQRNISNLRKRQELYENAGVYRFFEYSRPVSIYVNSHKKEMCDAGVYEAFNFYIKNYADCIKSKDGLEKLLKAIEKHTNDKEYLENHEEEMRKAGVYQVYTDYINNKIEEILNEMIKREEREKSKSQEAMPKEERNEWLDE